MVYKGTFLYKVIQDSRVLQEMVNAIKLDEKLNVIFNTTSHPGALRVDFTVTKINKRYKFLISQMPGQCGILVIHSVPYEYYQDDVNDTIGEIVHDISVEVAKYLKYGRLMLTHTYVDLINIYAFQHGWRETAGFVNPHTNNNVWILYYDIKQEELDE